MQTLKCAGCVRVATVSILVYAYILIYYTKNRGFENQWFLKGGFGVRRQDGDCCQGWPGGWCGRREFALSWRGLLWPEEVASPLARRGEFPRRWRGVGNLWLDGVAA